MARMVASEVVKAKQLAFQSFRHVSDLPPSSSQLHRELVLGSPCRVATVGFLHDALEVRVIVRPDWINRRLQSLDIPRAKSKYIADQNLAVTMSLPESANHPDRLIIVLLVSGRRIYHDEC
nr:hypothetical protein [Novosphingobium kunmingense]